MAIQRLHLNQGGYAGETVNSQAILDRIRATAPSHGWQIDSPQTPSGISLTLLRRTSTQLRPRVYLSAGIHGDEPAGVLAIEQLLAANTWPADVSWWLCPALNPMGLARNRRENNQGIDLNRDYLHRQSEEVRCHIAWLEKQPSFDLTICLHEDWEADGFYLYELNPDGFPSPAEQVIQQVAQIFPISDAPVIDGWPARQGIIRLDPDPVKRPRWAEAFYLLRNKTRRTFTLETASDFPLENRVEALLCAVRTLCGACLSAPL